jgi:hypothetical protein
MQPHITQTTHTTHDVPHNKQLFIISSANTRTHELGPGARAFVFEVPDGAAGVPAAGVGADAARVGATRSVMSYLIDGARSQAGPEDAGFYVAWAAVSGLYNFLFFL